jgi:hypothetical protein
MKWFSVILIGSLALLSNACEKHPKSELPAEHATAFGPHAAGHDSAEKHGAVPADEHASAKPETPAQTGEVKPGEAPKFFPEKK